MEFITVNDEPKIIKFSDILGCMKESVSCPRGVHKFFRFPNNILPTVPFVDSYNTGCPNMDISVVIYFERSIDDGKNHGHDHHLRSVPVRYNYYLYFPFFLLKIKQIGGLSFLHIRRHFIFSQYSPFYFFI